LAVEVELYGNLALQMPRRQKFELEHPMTAKELAIDLGLDPTGIGLVAINGKHEDINQVVPKDGRVCFFPHLSGG
jgi:hypothetical protein